MVGLSKLSQWILDPKRFRKRRRKAAKMHEKNHGMR